MGWKSLRNSAFQHIWFAVRGAWPRKIGPGLQLLDYSSRIEKQLGIASWFGGADVIIAGDSNGENLADKPNMLQLGKKLGLSCNIAIGGTRADTWMSYLKDTSKGRSVAQTMGKKGTKLVWNVGGNHVLQRSMENVRQSLRELNIMFPDSWCCLVPPIHYSFFAQLGMSEEELKKDVLEVNDIIKELWGDRVIDFYTPFLNKETMEAYILTMADAVHFSQLADEKVRIPLIIAALQSS